MSVGGRPQDLAPRPPAGLVFSTPEHFVAFGLGAGLSPMGPGTVGTLWGLPLWLSLYWLTPLFYGIALVALTALGIWICGRSARLLGLPDCPGIVFDEIVGFMIAATPILPALGLVEGRLWLWLAAAFLLFRLFDIWKPWPIRWLDARVHGGLGIMLDDLLAGLYAAALLALAAALL